MSALIHSLTPKLKIRFKRKKKTVCLWLSLLWVEKCVCSGASAVCLVVFRPDCYISQANIPVMLCEPLCFCCHALQISFSCWNDSKYNSCHFNQKFSLIYPQTGSPAARWLVPVIFGNVRLSERSAINAVCFSGPGRCKHTVIVADWMDSYRQNWFSVWNCTLTQIFICLVKVFCFHNIPTQILGICLPNLLSECVCKVSEVAFLLLS